MFTLYTTALSANGRKVLAQSHHLGLEPEIRLVDVYRGEGRTPEYLAINETGKIPTLVDGDFTLVESNAILQYVCEAHAALRLYSASPKERSAITSWLFWESAHWQPALASVLSAFVAHKLIPRTMPAPATGPDWEHVGIRPLLSGIDRHLREHSFLALDKLTIADFSVAGMTTYFRSASFPFDAYPGLAAWYHGIEALDAWRATAVDLWTTP